MKVGPAVNDSPARWLVNADVGWQDLVRYGPPGFEVYARVALVQETDEADSDGEEPALREALTTLRGFTTTPDTGFAAIWEGWAGQQPPKAPRVAIPHRAMLLFVGPVAYLRDAPALAWFGSAHGIYQEPHLVWPDDQAWCLACELDEEIEFTVGGSSTPSTPWQGPFPELSDRCATARRLRCTATSKPVPHSGSLTGDGSAYGAAVRVARPSRRRRSV